MTVTEALMQPGSWELTLKASTPASTLDRIALLTAPPAWGHVLVTDARVPVDAIDGLLAEPYEFDDSPGTIPDGDPSPLPDGVAHPRYTGLLQERAPAGSGMTKIGGLGLLASLGDENRGQLVFRRTPIDDSFDPDDGIIPAFLYTWTLDGSEPFEWSASPLKRRYFFTPPPWAPVFFGEDVAGWISRFELLMLLSTCWGLDFVVRSHGWVDMGSTSQLFPEAVPVVVRDGGRDFGVVGLEAATLDATADVYDAVTGVILVNNDGTAGASTGFVMRDIFGRDMEMVQYIERTDVGGGQLGAYASTEAAARGVPHRQIDVSTATHDGVDQVVVGQPIDLYDPAQGLFDLASQQTYRGSWIYPTRTRVLTSTWPVVEGMGVYLRWHDGTDFVTIDLTDDVVFEQGDRKIEVGVHAFDRPRSPTPKVPNQVQPEATIDDPLPTQPPSVQGTVRNPVTGTQTSLQQALDDIYESVDPSGFISFAGQSSLTSGSYHGFTPSSDFDEVTIAGDSFTLPSGDNWEISGTLTAFYTVSIGSFIWSLDPLTAILAAGGGSAGAVWNTIGYSMVIEGGTAVRLQFDSSAGTVAAVPGGMTFRRVREAPP